MCDTMVALGNSTRDGNTIFAKNSDRQPNEPHLMLRVPRQTYPEGSKLKCTYITIDQVQETYDVLLLKPSWMWGAEMGANEFGLNIGNEAVFTKVKQGPPSLLGMDLVRLALERCKTSTEALHLIVELLEKYGQGGNCGYEKRFVYHNSFLLADQDSAWVLETAGPYWVAEKVKDIRAISNGLSIGEDFDLCHPQVIEHAISQGWCKSKDDFNFAKCYSNSLFTKASRSRERKNACSIRLQQEKGDITVQTMFEILRSHGSDPDLNPFKQASLDTVCMHGGGIVGDHTTGSYVASLDATHTYWLTGSSTPCISIFKPYWLTNNNILPGLGKEEEALDFWLQRERLHRLILENKVTNLTDYRQKAKTIEENAYRQVLNLSEAQLTNEVSTKLMNETWQKEAELVQATVQANKDQPGRIKGNLFFRRYWTKQTRKLGI